MEDEEEPKPKSNSNKPQRITITRKKVSDLTEAERNQLIADAHNGIENDYFNVKLCKNGSTRICLRKQTKAQQVISEANESNQAPAIPTNSRRYYTNDQLLMEHIINLETQYNKLHSKHKKLKKRYNELEGYLYSNDNDNDNDNDEDVKPKQQQKPKQEEQQEQIPQQQTIINNEEANEQQQIPQQIPRRRYVRSWRDLNSNQ